MNAPKSTVSRLRQPPDLDLAMWQVTLRRQYAAGLKLKVKNTGSEPVFSEYAVTNPATNGTYSVAIRGDELGVNYCTCPDFSVNTLGTCKHIEFTLAKLRRGRTGRAALARGYAPAFSEVSVRYGAQRKVVFRAGTACPDRVHRLATQFFGADGVLRDDAFDRFDEFLREATARNRGGHHVRCHDDVLAFINRVRARAALVARIDAAFPHGADDQAFDSLVNATLYPYQRQGALFAARAGRCLIADDMGLGKTVQAIAATEILARHANVQRVLVICPTSLKHQWQREIERFTNRSAVVVEGPAPVRAGMYRDDAFYTIVNYDILHRDENAIRQFQPDLIILDEAQRIKNWRTRAARTVKQLQSDHAFVLTGTPLENRLEELHSIVEFIDPHRLGPTFRFLAAHQHVDEHGKVIGYRNLDDISRTLEPILVRRTKEGVLKELPERLEKQFFTAMTAQQREYHDENREIVAKIVHKWRRFGHLSDTDQKRLMIALQKMRMSCDSTFLLDGHTDHGPKAGELMTLLDEVFEDADAKVVVFSQWLRMHELIIRRVKRRGWDHVLFHGGVPGHKRRGLIERFRDDPACRLFLSTDAGGVGLNLQNANVVVHMDLPWNPAVLEQRVGRVHRLGQYRPVRVIQFIARGTIEESMLGLIAFKRSMFAGVLDGGEREVFLGGTRLKQFMDSVESMTSSVPAPVAERATDTVPPASQPRAVVSTDASASHALGDLLTVGAAFLDQLGRSLRNGTDKPQDTSSLLTRDETTGQAYLRVPLPNGQALETLIDMLREFTSRPGGSV